MPVVAVLIAAVAGSVPSWEQLAGGAIVLAGVVYSQMRRNTS